MESFVLKPIGVDAKGEKVWRWPFDAIEVGRGFLVHQEDKSLAQVQQAAYSAAQRLARKFSTRPDGDFVRVTREPDGAELKTGPKSNAVFSGGGGAWLGILEPPAEGRWSWPFEEMQPGQYFHVRHEDRHPEKVRALVYLRAKQASLPLSVAADDPEMPGHARIEFLAVPRAASKPEPRPVQTANEFWKLMDQCAGLNPNSMELDFWLRGHWEREIAWDRLPAVREHVVTMQGGDQYRFIFEDDRLVSEFLGNISSSLQPLPPLDKGDIYGTMFAGEKPVDEVERKQKRKLLDD